MSYDGRLYGRRDAELGDKLHRYGGKRRRRRRRRCRVQCVCIQTGRCGHRAIVGPTALRLLLLAAAAAAAALRRGTQQTCCRLGRSRSRDVAALSSAADGAHE